MASIGMEEIAPDVDCVFEASTIPKNKKKSKKPKKERKDKTKTKRAADILLEDGCHDTVSFTQMHDCKIRKKAKKNKIKTKEDSQLLPPIRTPKSENQLKLSSTTHTGFTHQIHPVICVSPDPSLKHSSKRGCLNRVKEVEIDKIRKRVVFNLPPEPSRATNTHVKPFTTRNAYNSATYLPRAIYPGNLSQGKQLVGESSLESQATPEEMSSQDLFITQKSFSEPNLNLSSSACGNDITIVSVQEEHSCRMTVDTATQTENFFTFPEVANCLRFQQQQKTSTCTEEPMDLRLPRRARQVQRANQPAKHPVAICIGQPKLQISDTSSEDGDMMPKTKGELSQLKVIQTRLNESFFFKVKGYDSPKPVCPLMKLSTEKKTK
ncbi:uncharacterized protein si:ch211-176l24.4 [Triplophysa dalaica]|uniref:uncharacterized protein si:ch211-176l24.4 n=1 Tax=Triplophysa dalaica TaxID=1582913 RepID=UPI0024E010F3|nr:uncharacterized protein si:ch211-176l24.4 [Triplophysa dalaica]XP_056596019.1 uncharacterized protein si:ch211-176l24.4 [Triplophysa dalaica]